MIWYTDSWNEFLEQSSSQEIVAQVSSAVLYQKTVVLWHREKGCFPWHPWQFLRHREIVVIRDPGIQTCTGRQKADANTLGFLLLEQLSLSWSRQRVADVGEPGARIGGG